MMNRVVLIALMLSSLVLAACGPGDGLPKVAGQYKLKEKSVTFDGEKYSFFWADAVGNLTRVRTDDVKLKLGDQNMLEITDKKDAILNLKDDEPVAVEGRDQKGDFSNFWYPFMIGSMMSRGFGGGGPIIVNNNGSPGEYRQPSHRYPPTDQFNRGDTIGGSVSNTTGRPPDYSRVQPASNTISGQGEGSGGGNSATNKADTDVRTGGQASGTGSGSAVLNKSGSFKSGSQGFDSKVQSGALAGASRSSTGSGRPSINTGGESSSSGSSARPSSSSGSRPSISTSRRR